MDRTIAYRVMVPALGPWRPLQTPYLVLVESGDCTEQVWETGRKVQVHERWKGTGYKVRVWPPLKWRKGENT